MENKLPLCPVCGSPPYLSAIYRLGDNFKLEKEDHAGYEFNSGKYLCTGCGLHISVGDWKSTTEECAEEWNRRVATYLREQEPDFCGYCEENSDGFVHNVCFDKDDKHIGFNAYGGKMSVTFTGFSAVGLEDYSRFEFPIKYCPFCGRKFASDINVGHKEATP